MYFFSGERGCGDKNTIWRTHCVDSSWWVGSLLPPQREGCDTKQEEMEPMHVLPLFSRPPTSANEVRFDQSSNVILTFFISSPYNLDQPLDNTFILALDGDVEFNYIGVQRLVEVMIPGEKRKS